MQHPLINKTDSPHYDGKEPGEKPLIEQFEERYSPIWLYHWATISSDKYIGRMGKKDDIDKETRKMQTYIDYANFLKNIIDKYPVLADMTAKTAYEHLNIKMKY